MKLAKYVEELEEIIDNLNIEEFENILKEVSKRILDSKKVLICGNGGSAADSQHLAAELVVRFEKNRKPIGAIALTTDSSILTACGNDFSFKEIFSRQVEAIGQNGDILICFSTSGNSENVIEAAKTGKLKGLTIIGFLGKDGGKLKNYCDYSFIINCKVTSHIQEIHQILYHYLCKEIEKSLS